MPRRRKKTLTDQIYEAAASADAMRQISAGTHTHVAELYGGAMTIHLRPWARRAVLSGAVGA